MEYTLDTSAIRRRFEQAIIGIRQDGTMAVLVETITSNWFDIVDGGTYNEPMVRDLFTTLIRPLPAAEPNSTDGCTCQDCGCVYKVDWLIPDALWQQIQDRGEGGLLCGSCIAARVEKLDLFNAFHFESETVSDYPSCCSNRRTFTTAEMEACPKCGDGLVKYADLITDEVRLECPTCRRKENELNRRLAAAEQELAAIRAEMEGTK